MNRLIDQPLPPLFISKHLIFALVLTGILAGLTGIVLTHLLHWIQQIVFLGHNAEEVSFRELVQQAEPMRRVWILLACGAIVGVVWTALHRYAPPLIDIATAVKNPEQRLPTKTLTCHSLLQILTVGMGSPLGREVAPREMSVALASPLTAYLTLDVKQRQVILACASGAGLAAVYNVPFAATVFVLETLLLAWDIKLALAALLASGIAVGIVRVGLGDIVQYDHILPLEQASIQSQLIIWAILAGVVLAIGVNALAWCSARLPQFNRKSWRMIPIALFTFGIIGCLSVYYPEILGNGKAGNQLSFAANLTWQDALGLLVSKWVAILLATVAGAYGGRITPSMMLGGMIGFLLAMVWNLWLPEIPLGAAAFIGATVFLGLAQNMHLTAIVFMLELSRLSSAYWLPVCLCMATAIGWKLWRNINQ